MASASYQRRLDLARERGYSSVSAMDRARRAARAGDATKLKGPDRAFTRAGPAAFEQQRTAAIRKAAATRRRQIVDMGGGKKIVRTTSRGRGFGVLEAQVRNARPDQRVHIVITNKEGGQATLYGNGIRAGTLARLIDELDFDGMVADALASHYGAGAAIDFLGTMQVQEIQIVFGGAE